MDPTQRTKRHQKANFSTQYGTHDESGQASGMNPKKTGDGTSGGTAAL
jgi:hypothetical protein